MDPNREPLRKIPTIHVPQVTQDIGSTLKAKRESRGHSVDAVSQHTRIPKRFLDALEKNRLDEFPALVYLRGFLKGYCEYLELDFEPLWALIEPPEAKAPPAGPGDNAQAAAPAPKNQAPSGTLPRSSPSVGPASTAAHGAPSGMPSAPKESEDGTRSAAGALLLAAAMAIGVFLLVRKEKSPLPMLSPEAPRALAPLDAHAESSLEILFREEAWISLRADGVLLFEGRAPRGARQAWKAKRGFTLRTPQPKNLDFLLDGKAFEPRPGPDGDYKIE